MDHHSDQMWVIVETHDQEFAVSANDVREIVVLPDVTAVPNCRPQDRGVINLRGAYCLYSICANNLAGNRSRMNCRIFAS